MSLAGIIAAGTVCHLADSSDKKIEQKKMPISELMLWSNHVLLMQSAAIGVTGLLPFISKIVYLATPAVLLAALKQRQVSQQTLNSAHNVNNFYVLISVISSVVAIFFGNPLFGLASIAMFIFDSLVKKHVINIPEKPYSVFIKICSILAYVGYGSWILSLGSILDKIVLLASTALLIGPSLSRYFNGETASSSRQAEVRNEPSRSWWPRFSNPFRPSYYERPVVMVERPVYFGSPWPWHNPVVEHHHYYDLPRSSSSRREESSSGSSGPSLFQSMARFSPAPAHVASSTQPESRQSSSSSGGIFGFLSPAPPVVSGG